MCSAQSNHAAVDGLIDGAGGGPIGRGDRGIDHGLDGPRLLLLDEPTTGLDPRSRIELWDAIRMLVDGGTDVLLTTQYLDEADHLASQVVIIDRGRAVATGTPSELKRRIGGNVVEVHVRQRTEVARTAELLGQVDHGNVEVDEPTRRVSVRVDSGGGGLMRAMQLVRDAAIEVEDIGLRQPNLDEVFLALTGRPTDTQPSAATAA